MVRLRARLVGGMRNDPCVIPFRLEVTCCRGLCLWWAEIYPPSSVAYATNCLQFSSPRGEAFLTPCKHGKYVFESWGVFTIRPHPSPKATDEGESICFRSSLCCVGCVVRKKSCKRLPLGGKLARKRLMRGDNSAPHKSIFPPERNDTWGVSYNISFPIGNTLCRGATHVSFRPPPTNRARSRTLQQIHTSQTDKKLPPRAPAPNKANQIFALHGRALLGEVRGR